MDIFIYIYMDIFICIYIYGYLYIYIHGIYIYKHKYGPGSARPAVGGSFGKKTSGNQWPVLYESFCDAEATKC